MIVYKDYNVFTVLGEEIGLISSETAYGLITVAEIANQFYYLDSETPSVGMAIITWQEFYNRTLTNDEIIQVMQDNKTNGDSLNIWRDTNVNEETC